MLTYNEWFEQNMGIGGTPADYATEYARYYHAELSRPPKDVVEAIENEANFRYQHFENNATKKHFELGFTDGGKYGYSLASGDKWVSVNERLPEYRIDEEGDKQYQNVLASNGEFVYIASCEYWETDKGGEWHMYGDYGTTTVEVTHWQPLPSPPKQQQHG